MYSRAVFVCYLDSLVLDSHISLSITTPQLIAFFFFFRSFGPIFTPQYPSNNNLNWSGLNVIIQYNNIIASAYMNMAGPPPQSLLCSSLDYKYTDVARLWCGHCYPGKWSNFYWQGTSMFQ